MAFEIVQPSFVLAQVSNRSVTRNPPTMHLGRPIINTDLVGLLSLAHAYYLSTVERTAKFFEAP